MPTSPNASRTTAVTTLGAHRVKAMTETKTRHGWLSLYAGAFAGMLGAGVALAASSFGTLRSIGLLWVSVVLSVLAIAMALASLFLPRRS
jgi:uncharacterized membrane protein